MTKRRDQRMVVAITRVLDRGEDIVHQGRCWAAVRRPRVPLLLLGRHQYHAFLTDRRLVLIKLRHRRLRPADVVLVKRFSALTLFEVRQRLTLLQQRMGTDTGLAIVVEWPVRSRRLGHVLAHALSGTVGRQAA